MANAIPVFSELVMKIDGDIKIGEKTGSLTLIHLAGGLGSGSTVQINTTEGAYDAEGDIHVGPTVYGGSPPPAISFDGCIRIYDDGAGGGEDLDGNITVVGCHDPDGEELIICIDGDDNDNVTLDQLGCTGDDATWGCDATPNCP